MWRTKYASTGHQHIVKIGDKLNDKYEIKAVHSRIPPSFCWHSNNSYDGSYSTYLAKDINSKYVCLQLLNATGSIDPVLQTELELLDRILSDNDGAGRDLIHAPVEDFWVERPNGKLKFLVYDLYGLSLNNTLWPISMMKKLTQDSLQALEYLHGKGVCHGSMLPSNDTTVLILGCLINYLL